MKSPTNEIQDVLLSEGPATVEHERNITCHPTCNCVDVPSGHEESSIILRIRETAINFTFFDQ